MSETAEPPDRPRLPPAAVVGLALVALAPTVTMAFMADDLVHQLVLAQDPAMSPMRPWALYDFGTGAQWRTFEGNVGALPWWTGPDWKVRFLRPVTSLYLWGQHALFGGRPLGYHLVALGLWALLLVQVHRLFRQLGLGARAAGTGALLLALCDAALFPVGWPANANSLLVALFAVGALRASLPDEGRGPRVGLALALAVLAALSKESGVVALVLVAAALWAAARRDERRRSALRGGAGAAAVLAAAYVAFLLGAGYGTRCLFYASPWDAPAAFAANLAMLSGAGLVSLVGPFPLDAVTPFPAARLPLTLVGLALGVPLALWVARRVAGRPGAGWLALWTAGFLATQGAAPPADRLLFVPAIGAVGLMALFFEREEREPSRPVARRTTRVLWLTMTVGSGLYLFLQGAGIAQASHHLRDTALATEVGSPELGHRDVFVLQTESQMQAFALAATWAASSEDHDLAFWACQIGNRPLRWTRVDGRTFDVESLGAPFLVNTFERVYLTDEPALEVGEAWSTAVFDVEVAAVSGGVPTRLRFRVNRSLDDPTVRFVAPRAGRLVALDPPPVGASLELPTPERTGPYLP